MRCIGDENEADTHNCAACRAHAVHRLFAGTLTSSVARRRRLAV
jgi:hypothetical protein